MCGAAACMAAGHDWQLPDMTDSYQTQRPPLAFWQKLSNDQQRTRSEKDMHHDAGEKQSYNLAPGLPDAPAQAATAADTIKDYCFGCRRTLLVQAS